MRKRQIHLDSSLYLYGKGNTSFSIRFNKKLLIADPKNKIKMSFIMQNKGRTNDNLFKNRRGDDLKEKNLVDSLILYNSTLRLDYVKIDLMVNGIALELKFNTLQSLI